MWWIRWKSSVGKSLILTSLLPRTGIKEKIDLYSIFGLKQAKHSKEASNLGISGGGTQVCPFYYK